MQRGKETRKAFGQTGVFFRRRYGMFHPFLEIAYQCLMKGGLEPEAERKYALRLTDYGVRKAIMHRENTESKHWIGLDDTLDGILEIVKTNRQLSEKAEMIFAEFIYAVSEYRNDYAVDALELVKGRSSFNLLVDAVCSRLEDNENAGGEIYSRKKRDLLCGLLTGKEKFSLTEKQQILVAEAIARENVMKRYDAMDVLNACNGNLCKEAKKILEKTATIFTSAENALFC